MQPSLGRLAEVDRRDLVGLPNPSAFDALEPRLRLAVVLASMPAARAALACAHRSK
jgi:hypothetical protein